MQTVERADAEFGPIPTAEMGTYLEGSFGNGDGLPDSGGAVIVEVAMKLVCFRNGHLPAKHLLCNRMRPFGNVKRGNRRAFAAAQHVVGSPKWTILEPSRRLCGKPCHKSYRR